jgi:hypothetical protein
MEMDEKNECGGKKVDRDGSESGGRRTEGERRRR